MMLLRPQTACLRLCRAGRSLRSDTRPSIQLSRLSSRRSSTTATAVKGTSRKPLYPERLLIYHSGTSRTVFLGCLKVTTIFVFTFFALVVSPSHFYSEDQQKWISIAVLLSGTVPLVAVSYITAPFVTYIHLRLPTFARHSRELLLRFSKSLPPTAELDITTMNFVGKPRVIRLKASELKAKRERFGLVNYVREEEVGVGRKEKNRPWWMGRKQRIFGVHGGKTKIMGGEVWDNVRKGIEKKNI